MPPCMFILCWNCCWLNEWLLFELFIIIGGWPCAPIGSPNLFWFCDGENMMPSCAELNLEFDCDD